MNLRRHSRKVVFSHARNPRWIPRDKAIQQRKQGVVLVQPSPEPSKPSPRSSKPASEFYLNQAVRKVAARLLAEMAHERAVTTRKQLIDSGLLKAK